MPSFDIVKETRAPKTFRVASVMGKFDLQSENVVERFTGEIPLKGDWQIGLIVGSSGTGKTTIARELFPDAYVTQFEYKSASILDDMPKDRTVDEITQMFNSVGFSSPPSWLKPYAVLSNGQKMRVDLAFALLQEKDLIVFDEFTSVVDRKVAQIGSFAIQKTVRRTNRKFIAVTCHYDVEEWLLPDWVFDTDSMTFRSNDGQKKNRPDIKFEIFKTTDKSIWRVFAKHHYLSHSHNNASDVFVAYVNGDLAGFFSVLPFPHPHVKHAKKGHRSVVLPDYQGIGIGVRLMSFVAEYYVRQGYKFLYTTSHPALIFACKKNPCWRLTFHGRRTKGSTTGKIHNKTHEHAGSYNRVVTSWEYVIDEPKVIETRKNAIRNRTQ